ncbi:MAG: hypothetical protein RLZZ546_2726 [Bacteroidota bacterium]|jgi:putative DNA primase/helicase
MELPKSTKNHNLKILKKTLKDPKEFKKTDYKNKACFTYNYTKCGYFDNWDIALGVLNNLPDNENLCHEVIMPNTKVKPYLDIEYIKEEHPDLNPDEVKIEVMRCLIEIFKDDFSNFKLRKNDIYFSECHRKKHDQFKYSFHVVISTTPTIVFENTNKASFLARKLREKCKFDESIIDIGVYKTTQNFRLVGHSKFGEYIPFKLCNSSDDQISKTIITNIDTHHIILNAPEQEDSVINNIKNTNNYDLDTLTDEDYNYIIDVVRKKLHPSAYFVKIDNSGFLQFNYEDRNEPCFCHTDKEVYHDQIGFFIYIYNNDLHAGCYSGNCSEEHGDNRQLKKIIKRDLGRISKIDYSRIFLEKVSYDNEFNDLDPSFIFDCVTQNAFGISNLFEKMYLNPKRIKWVSGSSKNGTTYFWNGDLWIEDDFSFVSRLLVATVVKVLQNAIYSIVENDDLNNNEEDNPLIVETQKMITQLNSGRIVNSVLKFFQPLTRDIEFLDIKDHHPYFLSCKNGMVNLYTGEIRDAVPDDNITKTLDVIFDPDADDNDFDEFVKQITTDLHGEYEDTYNYLKWCIGYALQGNPCKKIFIVLYGQYGYNGKSMLMNTISDVLKYYSSPMDKSVVLEGPKKTAGSHSTELMQLEHARLGVLSDVDEDAVIYDGMIKQLTGITDKISAREIYGKQREFIPKFVPFINTNHAIKMNLSDKAMYERLILIPFELSFVDNPKKQFERQNDPYLADKFRKNKEGVLKWLVNASIFYNQNPNLPIPEKLLKAKDEYNNIVNPYVNFLSNNFDKEETSKISRASLLGYYKEYCRENNMKFVSKNVEKEFDKLLKSTKEKRVKYYLGIKYIEEIIDEVDDLDM